MAYKFLHFTQNPGLEPQGNPAIHELCFPNSHTGHVTVDFPHPAKLSLVGRVLSTDIMRILAHHGGDYGDLPSR